MAPTILSGAMGVSHSQSLFEEKDTKKGARGCGDSVDSDVDLHFIPQALYGSSGKPVPYWV